MPRRTAALVCLVASALALSGCVGMPESGPVVESTTAGTRTDGGAVNINPRRPGDDDTPEEIVRGFLQAMQATPAIKTSVAREFLTQEASVAWQPTETIIYSTAVTRGNNDGVTAELDGAERTDGRGAWLGPLDATESTLRFPMELQDNEWRIAEAPNALIVPQSWFETRFRQASLYFFDPTASILVPEPVFVPRGRQFASALVNGLLAGPPADLAARELTFLPPDLRSVVSVPVSQEGVAQVDLISDAEGDVMPDPTEAELLVSQVAWTLRQDVSIERFRISIGSRPVQLPDGETTFGVDHGHGYAPYVAGSSTQMFGLRDGLMVGGTPLNLETVTGPFGQPGYALRSVATDVRVERAAAVSATGTEVFVGPVKESPVQVTLAATGENLLQPAWDHSGRLWLVDRRSTGAVVQVAQDDRIRTLDVPGISGTDVKDFLVSRDGSRLVAVVRVDADTDLLLVSRITTSGDGSALRATPAVDVGAPDDLGGTIRAIAWRSPTSMVVLHPVSRRLFQVRTATVDGAPAGPDAVSVTLDQDVVGLAGTPVPDEPLYAVVGGLPVGSLVDLGGPRTDSMRLDPGITSLDYVG